MTRKETLKSRARAAGLKLDTWSPGDGATRYRFAHASDPSNDYFGFASARTVTALGIAEAEAVVSGALLAVEVIRAALLTEKDTHA